ncbi:hypothetical protein KAI12_02700 [Candidatus Bathyarchaeota archaeon]|nr:hypothetical protein [Candidatus Bathyarchaeota archaeon]
MSEQKPKKKQKQELVVEQEKAENKNVGKLVQALEELKHEEKFVDIQVCPKCKSARLRRVNAMMGDMMGHVGWLPVIYECLDCGWRGRLEVLATNKKQSWKEIALIAEASDIEE